MKKQILIISLPFLFTDSAFTQGCIMLRNITGYGQYNLLNREYIVSNWQITLSNRYYNASNTYIGTQNQNIPKENQTVINSYSVDLVVTRLLDKGWSMTLSIPVTANSRSSVGEHGGKRHSTHSFGLNDIILTVYKWLLKPHEKQKFNFQFGLGLKFPTGAYDYQDYFYWPDSIPVLAPVNPSIQLGDGGTGFSTELNFFYVFNKTFSLYGNLFYLFNPRDQNGVSPLLGHPPTAEQIQTYSTVTSVTDNYAARVGGSAAFGRWIFSGGFGIGGVPVHDALGPSTGIRRGGYNMSIDPGLTFVTKSMSAFAFVPIFFKHDIEEVDTDRDLSRIYGTDVKTAGGSGDYTIVFGVSFNL
jgi:hypothetical protein